MSYSNHEKSDYDAEPLELYRFAMGDKIWLYTSADCEVAIGDDTYKPVFIEREGFTKGGDAKKSDLTINMAATNEIALMFRTGWLSTVLIVTIFRHHYNDDETSVLWKGRITSCKWQGSKAMLTSENAYTLFGRAGLRRPYQVGCPHVLFGDDCGLNGDNWKVSATVKSVDDKVVTLTGIDGYAEGYFVGGMVKFDEDLRMITAHSVGVVTMVDSIEDLDEGDTVTIWPGCARTMNACKNKFNNLDNYGGLPFLPAKNPFSGDAIV